MKKILLLVAFLVAPGLAFCQYFELTPEGMKSSVGDGKNFVVLEFPEKTQAELFDLARNYIVSAFNSAKDVMSESRPAILSANAILPCTFKAGFNYNALVSYKYGLAFKDGRIKVDFDVLSFSLPPQSKNPKFSIGLVASGFGTYGVFKKNGTVSSAPTKEAIEECANSLTKGLSDAISGKNVDNNW